MAVLIAAFTSTSRLGVRPQDQALTRGDHIAWVADSLKKMQTIKPGMTRQDLLAVFTTEGGLSTREQRTYVSRDCQYPADY
jgi:hypothetical protein